jgi:hypothetical protein
MRLVTRQAKDAAGGVTSSSAQRRAERQRRRSEDALHKRRLRLRFLLAETENAPGGLAMQLLKPEATQDE